MILEYIRIRDSRATCQFPPINHCAKRWRVKTLGILRPPNKKNGVTFRFANSTSSK